MSAVWHEYLLTRLVALRQYAVRRVVFFSCASARFASGFGDLLIWLVQMRRTFRTVSAVTPLKPVYKMFNGFICPAVRRFHLLCGNTTFSQPLNRRIATCRRRRSFTRFP